MASSAETSSGRWWAVKRSVYRGLLKIRNRHLLGWDVAVQFAILPLAFLIRLGAWPGGAYARGMWQYALLSAVIVPGVHYALGMYRRFWRYASLDELWLVGVGALLGSVATAALYFLLLMPLGRVAAIPGSIPAIALLLLGVATAAPRFGLRLANSYRARVRLVNARASQLQRVLIAGAGDAGVSVLREMLVAHPELGYEPVGFVDDDESKQGLEILGCRVLGDTHEIPNLVRQLNVQQVVIAMPSAGGAVIRRLVDLCQAAGVETFTVPGMGELLSGRVTVDRLRHVRVEDLLRREPVRIDRGQVERFIAGRRVLVTGAGGSIGSELCRQVARCGPERLILLGHGENSIYQIERELRKITPSLPLEPVIADIRDEPRLAHLFARWRPQVVLHAAAHKHVPLMEGNAADAVTNNILGTRNLLETAARYEVDHLVMISSDKAVNPTNIMGATKRVAELIVQEAAQRSGRAYAAVRFGNVLGSRGSVVPLFEKQIAAGGPVTVTHPDVKRYFMTIPEAVQLVLQAAAFGQGGEVFVLDMGDPICIANLARDMIRLAGYQPGRDIPIDYIGLRRGEKLFEELRIDEEYYAPSPNAKIFVMREQEAHRAATLARLERLNDLIAAAHDGDEARIRALLKAVVPEYTGD